MSSSHVKVVQTDRQTAVKYGPAMKDRMLVTSIFFFSYNILKNFHSFILGVINSKDCVVKS